MLTLTFSCQINIAVILPLDDATYPTIQVTTLYPGASPEVISQVVTAPLERQFGEMPGLARMSSTSVSGASIVTLQFNLGERLDVAEQEVQAAMNAADALLPADLPAPPIYAKVNPADTPVLTLAITSKTMPLTEVQRLVDTRLAPEALSGCRRWACPTRGWPTSGDPHPGRHAGAGQSGDLARHAPHRYRQCQRKFGEGQLRWPNPRLPNQCQRPVADDRRL